MQTPEQTLKERFNTAITASFGPDYTNTDPLISASRNPDFADYQANVAMSLAKKVGQNPRDVANTIITNLNLADICDEITVAGPGFINLRLKNEYLNTLVSQMVKDARLCITQVDTPQTIVVDYSSPNVAKEMHVGHLRSTVIGDAIVRALEFMGHNVIRQNHIGDWGKQFGMLIEYILETGIEQLDGADIEQFNALYKKAQAKAKADDEFNKRAGNRVALLQSGDPQTLDLWKRFIQISTQYFQSMYERMQVTLNPEHIFGESAYNDFLPQVVEELKNKGLTKESDGAICVFIPGYENKDGEPVPMIVQKSDGGFGYSATDLAGVRYRTQSLNATRLIYVIDARQQDHLAQVFWVAEQMNWLNDNAVAEHVKFGTVMGEDGKPFKTREGDNVKLADLLTEATDRAYEIVTEKNPDLDEAERRDIATAVGIGAVKYADLSSDRVKDYIFSWDRMLAMSGNTAPYLQMAYSRNRAIFRKAETTPEEARAAPCNIEHQAAKQLVLKVLQFGTIIDQVVNYLEPHRLCTYLYELSSVYSSFYEKCPVLKADPQTRASRLVLCDLTAQTLKIGLSLLGIDVKERM